MFSILTAIIVVLVILAGVLLAYHVRTSSPTRKRLNREITREEAGDIINRTSPYKTDMEISEELNEEGGDKLREVTFSPLEFYDEEETEIVLMPVNPSMVFTYWIINEKTVRNFEKEHGPNSWNKSNPVLRLYNLSDNTVEEIPINDFASNWYLKVYNPGKKFKVVLGRRFPCGRFIQLAVSNEAETQRAGISAVIDKDWMPIDECWKIESEGIGLSSPEFMKI